MKHVLVLLGSPRAGGNSETLAQALLKGAESSGNTTYTIRLNGMVLGGCIDCRKCWSNGDPCVIRDGMTEVHNRIREADVIVFATPLYWYSWSAQIKPVWDRFLPFMHEKAAWDLRGKKAMLLSTAGDDRPDAFEGLVLSFNTSCDLIGMSHPEPLLAYGVFEKGDILKGDWIKKAEEIGRTI